MPPGVVTVPSGEYLDPFGVLTVPRGVVTVPSGEYLDPFGVLTVPPGVSRVPVCTVPPGVVTSADVHFYSSHSIDDQVCNEQEGKCAAEGTHLKTASSKGECS